MRVCKRILIVFVCILVLIAGQAQDQHFSLVNDSPLNLNPALSGIFEFDYVNKHIRLAGNFRQQWRAVESAYLSVPTPFNSASASIDGMIKRVKDISPHYVGAGLIVNHDESGDLAFTTQNVRASLAYHQRLPSGTHFLSGGVAMGFSSRFVDLSNAYFDNQWNGLDFDPSLPTGESFPSTRFTYPDLSAGIAFHNYSRGRLSYQTGFSWFHILRPEQTFLNDPAAQLLKVKFVAHGIFQIPLNAGKNLLPVVYYQAQSKTQELQVLTFYKVDRSFDIEQSKDKNTIGYQLGLGFRIVGDQELNALAGDALIVAAKLRRNALVLAAAYDINLSTLDAASNNRGAFEIAILYYLDLYKKNRKRRERPMKAKCPD